MRNTRQPNILIVMTDEQRFDVAGFAGNSIIRTPNLDRLAERAMVFDNAYTPSPICIPARQCFAVGQYPRTCGVERYGQDLPPNSTTFAKLFSQHAYRTVAAGKLHHYGVDQMQGWRERISPDAQIGEAYIDNPVKEAFDRIALQHDIPGNIPGSLKWTDQKEIELSGHKPSPCTARDEQAAIGAEHFLFRHFQDTYYGRSSAHVPLLFYLGLINPHYPYFAEDPDLLDYYLAKVEPFLDSRPFDHPFLGGCPFSKKALIPDVDIKAEDIHRATAAYYANVEECDRRVGRVLTAIEEGGQDIDDWIVIFTSDHGEMLGEHAIWEKQKFFEGSAKVPFFIRYPARWPEGGKIQENVNLIDVFATLCELCAIPTPEGLDSRSLVPLMDGDTAGWRNETMSQFAGSHLMIKDGDLKYMSFESYPEVLFDLADDPEELENRVEMPAYGQDVARFRKRAEGLGFGFSRS